MPRYKNGFVKLHRSIFDGDLAGHPQICMLFIHLISMANWQETKVYWCGQQKVLPPGSVVCGGDELAERLQISRTSVRRYLTYLVDTERIGQTTANQGTVITILNYSKYQVEDHESGHKVANGRPDNGQTTARQRPLNKEGKKVRSKENTYSPEFEKLWALYPKKVGKVDAYKVFQKQIDSSQYGEVERAIYGYSQYINRKGVKEEFIKHMATFLNESRWNEWVDSKLHKPPPTQVYQPVQGPDWSQATRSPDEIKALVNSAMGKKTP